MYTSYITITYHYLIYQRPGISQKTVYIICEEVFNIQSSFNALTTADSLYMNIEAILWGGNI